MSFDDYMESKVPGYKNFVLPKSIDQLAKLYSEYIISSKTTNGEKSAELAKEKLEKAVSIVQQNLAINDIPKGPRP